MSKPVLKFYDEFQVICKDAKAFDTDNPPLAFARRWDGTKSAINLQKAMLEWGISVNYDSTSTDGVWEYLTEEEYNAKNGSAAHWNKYCDAPEYLLRKRWIESEEWNARKKNAIKYVTNTPTKGFKLGKSVSRWSTSNKLFELIDPRGFMLQISAENLAILIASAEIKNGEILSDCKWAFTTSGGNAALINVESEYYSQQLDAKKEAELDKKAEKEMKVKVKDLEVGGTYLPTSTYRYMTKHNTSSSAFYVYLGRGDCEFLQKVPDWYDKNIRGQRQTSKNVHMFLIVISYLHGDKLDVGYRLEARKTIPALAKNNLLTHDCIDSEFRAKVDLDANSYTESDLFAWSKQYKTIMSNQRLIKFTPK